MHVFEVTRVRSINVRIGDLVRFDPTHFPAPVTQRPIGILLGIYSWECMASVLYHGGVLRLGLSRVYPIDVFDGS